MNDSEIKAPGELLKIAREKLGLSINDVSLATKINPRIIKALEGGLKEDLPPKSFTRGFIRSYSSYLKINADPIIEAYNLAENVQAPIAIEAEKTNSESHEAKKPTISQRSKTITISGVIVLFFVVFGIKQVFDKYSKEATVQKTPLINAEPIKITDGEKSPATMSTAIEPVTDETKPKAETPVTETKPKAETPVTEAKPKAETPVTEAKPKAETPVTEAKPKAETPVTEAKPKAETPVTEAKKANEIIVSTSTATATAKPNSTTEPVKPVLQEVMVEALDKVDLIIKTNEGTKKIQLQPEGIHTIKFSGKMSLEISDGGTVNLIHNGRDKGIPGDLGKSKTIQFP